MAKRGLCLFLAAFLLIPLAAHGQGASTGVGLTIADAAPPKFDFSVLVNNSGIPSRNYSIPFRFSEDSLMQSCGMIIDNKLNFTNNTFGADVTNNDFRNFSMQFNLNNLDIGEFNFSVNCTDNFNFTALADQLKFTVIPMDDYNGSSTDITKININNITNFVLERSTLATINFSGVINLSGGFDLDKFINFSSNKIQLDSSELSVLNKSATLNLYDLTFTNPRVLIEGKVCPSSICTEVSYSGGTFVFNVTHFTSYSSEETPSSTTTTTTTTGGGGGGAGGGGGILSVLDFTTDKKTIKVVLKQGQSMEETLSIKNTGTATLDVTTYLQALKEFIVSPDLDEIKTVLSPNEEQLLSLIFKAEENLKPDVYTGEIKVRGGALEKIVNTIIEVESAKPLFDVDVEVLPQYKSIFPGDDIFIDVSLFNIRGFGRVDVVLEYSIRDFQGNTIAIEEETVAVEQQAKFTRELLVPSDISPGAYVATVKVTYEKSVGISSDLFEVKAKAIRLISVPIRDLAPYLITGIGVIAIIVYMFAKGPLGPLRTKKRAPKTKEEETKVLKTEQKIKKLEKELAALESAYKSRFISEESYNNNKGRIEKELEKLREE